MRAVRGVHREKTPVAFPQAPVFSKLPRLPAVLGQFVHTFSLFE